MKLQPIKLSEAYESENNPRGNDFKGPSFDDLVASVKEKGVLTAVIARPRKKGTKLYEIVAGNRRFRAAQVAGLKEIPANIEELMDEQAREVQIIENLQREDVHPLEEGRAYRNLIEASNYTIPNIAAKVAKSENYVHQRLLITNLIEAAAKLYRTGAMQDGHAVLIAKLSPHDQEKAVKYVKDETRWGGSLKVDDLKEWIQREFYKPLAFQPWLKDKAAAEAVGPCKECPPNVPTLFGEIKEGQCTDLKCWGRKMSAYIAYRQKKNPALVLITEDYRSPKKGILGRSAYETVGSKPKERCDSALEAIVAEGTDRGTSLLICKNPKCKQHKGRYAPYQLTPEEKEKRKKEKEAEQKKEAAAAEKRKSLAGKINWPLTSSQLTALYELVIEGVGIDALKTVAERRGFESKEKGWAADYQTPIHAFAKKANDGDKAKLIFELLIEDQCGINEDVFDAVTKLLK